MIVIGCSFSESEEAIYVQHRWAQRVSFQISVYCIPVVQSLTPLSIQWHNAWWACLAIPPLVLQPLSIEDLLEPLHPTKQRFQGEEALC